MPTRRYYGLNKKKTKKNNYGNNINSNNINTNNLSFNNLGNSNLTIDNIKRSKKIKMIREEKYIKDLIEEFFPKTILNTYNYRFNGVNKEKLLSYYIYDKTYKEGKDFIDDFQCISLTFDHKNKTMSIDELHKCVLNGRKSLTNAIKIAYRLNYKYITLTDASTIAYQTSDSKRNCSFSLKMYNILLTGQSWYNKYGFYSDTHDFEQEEIQRIRNGYFYMIIYEFCDFNDKRYSDVITPFNQYFNINIYKLTKNVFKDINKIKKTLTTNREKDDFYCTLSQILNLFNKKIKYNFMLKMNIRG